MTQNRSRPDRLTGRFVRAERNSLAYMALLAAHIAHELSTPLTNMSLVVESARKVTQDPQVLEKLDRIAAIRQQCAAIIMDLMALGKFREPDVQETDLCTLAHAALLQAEPFRTREVVSELRAGPAPVLAEVDPIQIQLVLTDLLKNAYQATERGQVTLTLTEGVNRVRIAVADTGCGMAPEVRKHIFTAFYTTKGPGQGTGLGLTFCKNVVDSHRGKILVRSQPGRGSIFTVILPRRPTHADPGRG